MKPFVIAFALWLILPALLFWSLSSHLLVAFLSSALLLVLLPLSICCFVADRSLHPPWHRPGVQPKNQRNNATSDARAEAQEEESEARENAFESVVGHSSKDGETDVGELGALVGAAVVYYSGKHTNPRVDFDLEYEDVSIRCRDEWRKKTTASSASGKKPRSTSKETDVLLSAPTSAGAPYTLRGWHVPCSRARTVVLLVHGAGRDRRTFMRHIPVFFEAGYSTLLIDCREHGTSSSRGLGVGFTTREALDVMHAARYARDSLGYERVVACGTSQGGAAVIVGAVLGEELELVEETRGEVSRTEKASSDAGYLIDLVVAENPFTSRESCVGDVFSRLLGSIPRPLSPLLLPAKRALVTAAILVLRWRLGLFHPLSGPGEWRWNWQRAGSTTYGVDASGGLKGGKRSFLSGGSGGGRSPSSSLLPLPPLFSPGSPLAHLAPSEFNSFDLVDRLAPRPLLLMHGSLDEIVPPVHSTLLYAKARSPKKLWLVSDALHTALYNKEPEGWRDTVIGFMKEHGL
jgi:fermentation-respiration switch protein FrsA (DUF1100 family)